MRILAFIPARSGSVSVPDKNIRPLAGVPLAAYAVEAARACGLCDEVLLSTDSPRYLEVLAPFGVGADYVRPADLARGDSPTRPAVLHALDWFASRGAAAFDAVMILQPTAPFRTPAQLRAAVRLLEERPEATCVVGICRLEDHHPARIKKLRDGLWLEDFCVPEPDGSRRQDLAPPAYIRNGTIYLTRVSTLLGLGSILGTRVIGMEMPEANSINVDVELDFLVAEAALACERFRGDLAFFREFLADRGRAARPA
ncbi:MAG: acylneuraminate cytidylyltransferase family protein [Elusimicrobia bacterium]|nr:acylneuraminate cytidylyltransferase family protein [Elusimicrobiota bacterium]